MKITSLKIKNIRCFLQTQELQFSDQVNVIVGQNNSGKSTILHCLLSLQKNKLSAIDITCEEKTGEYWIGKSGSHFSTFRQDYDLYHFDLGTNIIKMYSNDGGFRGQLSGLKAEDVEPNNLIYPYFSKRKVNSFNFIMNENNSNQITGDLSFLNSKIDRLLSKIGRPEHEKFNKSCNEILGFQVTSNNNSQGKEAGFISSENRTIPISSMGEGVANILGLIADLCIAKNRVFLIEELENDLHPNALKGLLKLILECSNDNQFFITTHSNVVLRYLGCKSDTKIFNVISEIKELDKRELFVSEIREVENSVEQRRDILTSLGYELFDFDLWTAWLFLEESSAEAIIRDFLIPWFEPSLSGKLRTFSSKGINNLKPRFEEFNNLFVFLHLEPQYKNRVFVLMDGGELEKEICDEFKTIYVKSGWNVGNFLQLEKHNFEEYYPEQFKDKVQLILNTPNKDKSKNDLKKQLLGDLIEWTKSNTDEAREVFENCFAEIIGKLKLIKNLI